MIFGGATRGDDFSRACFDFKCKQKHVELKHHSRKMCVFDHGGGTLVPRGLTLPVWLWFFIGIEKCQQNKF